MPLMVMASTFAHTAVSQDRNAFIAYNPVDRASAREIFGTIIPALRNRGLMVVVSEVSGLEAPKLSLHYKVYIGLSEIEQVVKQDPESRGA